MSSSRGAWDFRFPKKAPIILAAVLSRKGSLWAPLAIGSCLTGVLVGDFIVYFSGYAYGEKVLGHETGTQRVATLKSLDH